MKDDNNDITLRDVINHFDSKFQRVDERFEKLENNMNRKFEQIDNRLEKIDHRLDGLETTVQTMHEDILAIGNDLYDHKHVFRPHTEKRLDRLERHAKLPQIPVPASLG